MNSYFWVALLVLVLLAVPVLIAALLLRKSRIGANAKPSATDEHSSGLNAVFSALRSRFSRSTLEQRLPWILFLGERDSGKSTVLNALDESSAGVSAAPGGLEWRLLDQGAITEIPGDFLVTADGRLQTDGRWIRLLRQLLHHRPESPVNGIVLAVSASQLAADDHVAGAKRRTIATAIRSKLDDLQRETGLVVPIHVLVTKCDEIRGFGAFCWETSLHSSDDMFGWVNPNTLESAFTPNWVDDAFDFLEESLVRHQLRLFGSRNSEFPADELAILPVALDDLRLPLRAFLTDIFHETAYVDSNFFRGIFFCGDSAVVKHLPATRLAVQQSAASLALRSPRAGSSVAKDAIPIAPTRRNIAFVRHLFSYRVFAETRIARPVTRIRFVRRRLVFATQLAIALFALIFSVGTARAWSRLSDLRDHRFVGLLNVISQTLSHSGQQTIPTVQTAYDLVDTLGTIHANGFQSFFLPESWGDPLNDRIAEALTSAFGATVYPAISTALDTRARTLMGSCEATAAPEPSSDDATTAITDTDFRKDPQYAAIARFDRQYAEWLDAIHHYDMLRTAGTGSYADLDELFGFLIGKNLRATDQVSTNYYYQRALLSATAQEVPITSGTYLDGCSRKLAGSLVNNFYASWFDDNPLLNSTGLVADGVEKLETGKLQQLDAASTLAQNIRDLDAQVTSSSNKWLTQVDFETTTYLAISQLFSFRFMDPDLAHEINTNGSESLAKLKETLLSTGSVLSGPVLEQHGSEIRVSGDAIALEVGLQALLHQDFAGVFSHTESPTGKLIVWNTAALSEAGTLRDSYNKFVHTQLPLLPPSMRNPVKDLAARSLNDAVLFSVQNAEEPEQNIDDTTALLAVRSFNEAAPVLTQLQASLPGGSSSATGSFQMLLTQEGVTLAKWLNSLLASQPLYPSQVVTADVASSPDQPLSFTLFGVSSADALDEFLAGQRDRVKALAQDYASPLVTYLHGQGLQHAAAFDRWAGITQDVKDYDAKKPGNPIAALESFIHADVDKITPDNGCRAVQAGTVSNDYFVQIREALQETAIGVCSQRAINTYNSEVASVFNAKLAGKFPFGPYPSQAGAPEADPYDVADYLSRINKWGPSLQQFFSRSSNYASASAFIKSSLGVRDMLAATANDGPPAADVVVYFRVDQSAEKDGNQIIDWTLEAGDNAVHYPGTENALRWHFGDPILVSLRYAKDSPYLPMPGAASPNESVDSRTVTWNYKDSWALFTLLNQHPSLASEFNSTPEMLASTLRFVIPVLPDTTRLGKKVEPVSAASNDTKVFVRLGLRIPDAKQPREIPVVPFPVQAPAVNVPKT